MIRHRNRIKNILRTFRPAELRHHMGAAGHPNHPRSQAMEQRRQEFLAAKTPAERLALLNQRVAQWQTNNPGQAIPPHVQAMIDRVTARVNGTPLPAPVPPVGVPPVAGGGQQGPPANAPAWGYRRNNNLPFVSGLDVPNGISQLRVQNGNAIHTPNGIAVGEPNPATPPAVPAEAPPNEIVHTVGRGDKVPRLNQLEVNPNVPTGYNGASLAPFRRRLDDD